MLINLKKNNDIIDPNKEFYCVDKEIVTGTIHNETDETKDTHIEQHKIFSDSVKITDLKHCYSLAKLAKELKHFKSKVIVSFDNDCVILSDGKNSITLDIIPETQVVELFDYFTPNNVIVTYC